MKRVIHVPRSRIEYLQLKVGSERNYELIDRDSIFAEVNTSFFERPIVQPRLYFEVPEENMCGGENVEYSINFFDKTLSGDLLLPRDVLFALDSLNEIAKLNIVKPCESGRIVLPYVIQAERELDKIRAIPGVGDVTAERLLKQFGSFEEVIESVRRGVDVGVSSLQNFFKNLEE